MRKDVPAQGGLGIGCGKEMAGRGLGVPGGQGQFTEGLQPGTADLLAGPVVADLLEQRGRHLGFGRSRTEEGAGQGLLTGLQGAQSHRGGQFRRTGVDLHLRLAQRQKGFRLVRDGLQQHPHRAGEVLRTLLGVGDPQLGGVAHPAQFVGGVGGQRAQTDCQLLAVGLQVVVAESADDLHRLVDLGLGQVAIDEEFPQGQDGLGLVALGDRFQDPSAAVGGVAQETLQPPQSNRMIAQVEGHHGRLVLVVRRVGMFAGPVLELLEGLFQLSLAAQALDLAEVFLEIAVHGAPHAGKMRISGPAERWSQGPRLQQRKSYQSAATGTDLPPREAGGNEKTPHPGRGGVSWAESERCGDQRARGWGRSGSGTVTWTGALRPLSLRWMSRAATEYQ